MHLYREPFTCPVCGDPLTGERHECQGPRVHWPPGPRELRDIQLVSWGLDPDYANPWEALGREAGGAD